MKIIITESQYNRLGDSHKLHKYIMIVRCPDREDFVEEFIVEPEDIEEYMEDGDESETIDDAINYFLNDYVDSWEQHFCSVKVLSDMEYYELTGKKPSIKFLRR